MALLFMEEYGQAITTAHEAIGLKHGYILGRVLLIAALAHEGRTDEAQEELEVMLEIKPDFSTDLLEWYPIRDIDRRLLYDGLHAAGLNEL
jgi:hypothetical protein